MARDGTSGGDEAVHVAVTGAAGYIGSRLVADIREAHPDWTITALDNFYLGEIDRIEDVPVREVDVRDREALADALGGADAVCHLAAISGVDDCEEQPDLAYETNVVGTDNVAYTCRQTGAALCFPISMAVLGDPQEFPITADHPRDPLNWYGGTKHVNERSIGAFAHGSFPAHLFMISNLYGDHYIGDRRVSKGTVINFFVDRALSGELLTVYEPGTQSRNFVHVADVARAIRLGVERAIERRAADETGTWTYEIGSDEDPSVHRVAEIVQEVVAHETGERPPIEHVENPRSGETLVEDFDVDTSAASDLGWSPERSVRETVESLVAERTG